MGLTITCFAASYAVALLLEISRLWLRSGVRGALLVGWVGLGLVAHTLYLVQSASQADVPPLSNWRDWYLLAAWVLAAVYLVLLFRQPRVPIGLLVLPLVLGLVAVAALATDAEPFPRNEASRAWGAIHGIALLVGTVVVLIGFVAGVMYLVQSWQLKHKTLPTHRFRLPSLEWLERLNYRSVLISAVMFGAGLISGLLLAQINRDPDRGAIDWRDPVIWSSALLFLWLVAVLAFGAFYEPARQGRKVAYFTVSSFVLLVVVLALLISDSGAHAA
ncbi:MAG: cytochrome c biogenesis protein CcsA, partial [Pirellulales bacterium]